MEKKRGRAGAFFLSGLMCLTSLAGLSGVAQWHEKARVRVGDAVAQGAEGAGVRVIEGHGAIGIKLFAEGVVVIGLSEVETASGVAAPGGAHLDGVLLHAVPADVGADDRAAGADLPRGGHGHSAPGEVEVLHDAEDSLSNT